ncbi:MAG: hydroxymethylbilane synthase [Pseudomonadota bacterium]
MPIKKTLRLGTRRSPLAWIQSSQVAAAVRAAHPDVEVELVGIETRGDRVLDKPLAEIEGKEFFTAELDIALREKRVDFSVHSLKDLSLDRPPDFVLAAVPKRANPRDIALFAPDVPQRLADGASLRIGTSSPRRVELLPPFLARALPHAAQGKLMLCNLRGNVDSRLRRLHEPRGSERQLDGIVLALAGLARLYADTVTEKQGRQLFSGLLEGLNLMVLPLTESPGAPGQGALAIECRADDVETRALLAALEDPATRGAIAIERALLNEHGGGCHQRFGATLSWLPELGGPAAHRRPQRQRQGYCRAALPAGHHAARAPGRDPRMGWQPSRRKPTPRRCSMPLRSPHACAMTPSSSRTRAPCPLAPHPCSTARRYGPPARRAGSHSPTRVCGCKAAGKDWARNSPPNSSPNRCCACRRRATGMC